jgi:hypothetical protein
MVMNEAVNSTISQRFPSSPLCTPSKTKQDFFFPHQTFSKLHAKNRFTSSALSNRKKLRNRPKFDRAYLYMSRLLSFFCVSSELGKDGKYLGW